jgi:hypothetical protein
MTHVVQLLFERAGGGAWISVGAGTLDGVNRYAALVYHQMTDPVTGNRAIGVRIRPITDMTSAEREQAAADIARLASAVAEAIDDEADPGVAGSEGS